MKQIILPSTNLEFTWLVIDGFMEKNFSPDKKVFVGRESIPALMQAVFHVSDHFWARENRRPKN